MDSGFSVTRKTGPDGTIILTNEVDKLDSGQYKVTEINAPGYVPQTESQLVTVLPNQTDAECTVTFYNTPEGGGGGGGDGEGSIRKINADNPTQGIPGAVIRVTSVKLDEGGSFENTYITKDGGYISKEDLDFETLPLGSYIAEEITPPEGFVLSSDVSKVKQSFVWDGETDVSLVFENSAKVKVQLKKVDESGSPLAGAVFVILRDGQIIGTEETKVDGTITVSNVVEGYYEFREVHAPEGFDKDPSPVGVYVNAEDLQGEQTIVVTKVNHRKRSLTISKRDVETGAPVPGTSFHIQGVNLGYENDVVTGADGTVTLSDMLSGCYEITETDVPAPYLLDANNRKTVWIDAAKDQDVVVDFRNSTRPGLRLLKRDQQTGQPIQGATFLVEEVNGGYSDRHQTDKDGLIVLDGLRPGAYIITEVQPAPGYTIKQPDTQDFYLRAGVTHTVTFQNTPKNAIIVEKYNSVTHEALPGCTFRLRYLAGASGTGGTIIGQKVTDKNGIAMWTGLNPGAYVVEEIDPADGYSIINASETVCLADNGEQSVVTVRFDNMPDGLLLVRKVCATNPSVTLQNAEFKITYADGTLIGDSNGLFITDENGEIRIEGLKPGKSVIVTEVKAPPGFITDTQSQAVQIKEGRTVTLTFKNQPKGKLIIQKRDSSTNQPLSGAEFRITTAADCEVGLDGVIGTSTLTQNGIFRTDAQGEIRITNLAPGAYVITEIKAPDGGYVIDTPNIKRTEDGGAAPYVHRPGLSFALEDLSVPFRGLDDIEIIE